MKVRAATPYLEMGLWPLFADEDNMRAGAMFHVSH